MADALASGVGWTILLAGSGAVIFVLLRRAGAHGILAPVAVGLAVRLAVMLIADTGSRSLGDGGFFHLDDQTYMAGATRLAELWGDGTFANPTRHDVLGTYLVGYESFLALLFALGTASLLVGKLANVLIGGVTVYLVARIAGRVLGDQAKGRAAWLAALAPSLVWWSAPLLKEALVTMVFAIGVFAATTLPRPRSAAVFAVVLGLLVLLRIPATIAVVVGAGTALMVAGRQVEGRWLSRPLVVFWAVLVTGLLAVVTVTSGGNLSGFVDQYRSTGQRMAELYGASAVRAPYDALKSLVTPLPWVFDDGTRNWSRSLYPGVWLLICAYPLAAIGAWRLRRRPEAALLVGPIVAVLTTNAVTTGFAFRQRSMIEPLVLVLAVAGARSWRLVGRCAAGALAVTAGFAGVQSGSPVLALAIAAVAAAIYAATRRLPDRPFDALPESPLIASLRALYARRRAAPAGR